MSIHKIKENLNEFSNSLDNYLYLYKQIPFNKNLKLFLNVILRINNKINKEMGKKELSNFDLSNVESLCSQKINSKSFLSIVISNMELNRDQINQIIDNKELSILHFLFDTQFPLGHIYKQIPIIKDEFISLVEKLQNLIKNKNCMNKLDQFLEEIIQQIENLNNSLEYENKERRKFLQYFNYPLKEEAVQISTIPIIINHLLTIANKTKSFLSEKIIYKLDNPEAKKNDRISHNENQKNKFSNNNKKIGQSNNLINMKYKLK